MRQVQKRDGSVVGFERERIERAIQAAMLAVNEADLAAVPALTEQVLELLRSYPYLAQSLISVEQIQDAVVITLNQKFPAVAHAYLQYRGKHAALRAGLNPISIKAKQLSQQSKTYFKNPFAEIVYLRSYARWIEAEQRRETWIETVDRYMQFMRENMQKLFTEQEYAEMTSAILHQEVMPSMRLMQFAGPAARYTNACAYNCAYIAPTQLRDFAEIMYLCMCGTGVGFSVESAVISQLPYIQKQTGAKQAAHLIADNKEGWSDALLLGLETWYAGHDLEFDYSALRPAGARLKTFGGKSSGPAPLQELMQFARELILQHQDKQLPSLAIHDLICKIGEIVMAGGIRRSALISLSDLADTAMRDAKKGEFFHAAPHRMLANNSAVYQTKPSMQEFSQEWQALQQSGTGERGIFNRGGLMQTLPARRLDFFRQTGVIKNEEITAPLGTNPCGEIILQSKQFCNLTEVIARPADTEATLKRKIRIATMLGTYQASLTNFPYLSDEWRINCENERLLGVSISGQWDCAEVRQANALENLRAHAIKINQEYAQRLNIKAATAVTCVKPSGTVSQLVDCAPGIHPRYAPYYLRRIRVASHDSLFKMLKNQGVPYSPETGQTQENATTFVFEFPIQAPVDAVCRNDLTALQQLEYWQTVKSIYTEHNPSVTISVAANEWDAVAKWLYQHWGIVGGLSFLPQQDFVYPLAPFTAISAEEYQQRQRAFANLDCSLLMAYETSDETEPKRMGMCGEVSCDGI